MAKNNKNNFIVFGDSLEYLNELTDEQLGQLYRAQLEYANGITPSVTDPEVKGVWRIIQHQMNVSFDKYESKCEQMRANATKCKQKQAEASESKQIGSKNKNKTKNKNIEIPNGISCTEPVPGFMPPPEPAPEDPPVITMPLNDGTEYAISEGDVTAWVALYPAVDIEQELRNMRGWLLDNPTKRKTVRGIRQFIGGWLRREQDRPHPSAPPARGAPGISPVKAGITSGTDFDKMAADSVLSLIG